MDEKHHYSKVSVKGQITLTKPIREALGLSRGDFVIMEVSDKSVTVRKAEIKPV